MKRLRNDHSHGNVVETLQASNDIEHDDQDHGDDIALDYDLSDAYLEKSQHDDNADGHDHENNDGLDAHRRERRKRARQRGLAAPSPFAMAVMEPNHATTTTTTTTSSSSSSSMGRGIPLSAAPLPNQTRRHQRRHTIDGLDDDDHDEEREARDRDDREADASIEDEDEDGDSSYMPSLTERQKRFRHAFGDIFENDEGSSGVPCFACEVLNGRVHTVKHSILANFMLKLTARDRIMTYDVQDYVRLANEYEHTIRRPHNRRLKIGQSPLPEFDAKRIYQHIHRPHIKNRHLRMELLVHDMFDIAEEMKDELRVEHKSLRHADGRPVKRTRKKALQGFNTLLVQLKHYNSYLDSIPSEQRMEALQASALANAGYGTERLLDNLTDHREDLLSEMLGQDGAGGLQDGSKTARKKARHR